MATKESPPSDGEGDDEEDGDSNIINIKPPIIVKDLAERMGLKLPGLALVHDLYQQVQAQGHGRSGTQAIAAAVESLGAFHFAD